MNSLFKMLCLALAVFHGISFPMIPHYKNKENFEEEQQREFFEGHMDRVSNNKYLESLRIQGRLPEPLIIAQRRNVRLP